MNVDGRGVSWGVGHFHLNVIAMHPHPFNRFFYALFPLSSSFHTDLDQFMSIKNISDLKVRGRRGQYITYQHGHHVLSQFGKYVFFAINKAWIYLSNGGDTLFCVLFIVEYQVSVGTSFSLDTGIFCHTRTCRQSCLSSFLSPAIM